MSSSGTLSIEKLLTPLLPRKCGQEKPSCLRCTNFGVSCDGYSHEGVDCEKRNLSTLITQRKRLLLPKGHILPMVKHPSQALFCAEQDHQYFEVFCNKTAFMILPYYDAGTFKQMLLQACFTEPSLRHAVVALGALDMKMETLQEFESLSLENKATSAHQHHLNALEEYSVAIRKMRV
jgi:hypothetical protein